MATKGTRTTSRRHAARKAARPIRAAGMADLDDVAALEAAAFQPYRRAHRASLRRSLASGHQSVWVIDAPRGSPTKLAALLVLWHFPHRLRVYDVATAPAMQGQGLGGRLMAHAERLAADAGATWVSLEADPKEPHLVPWYRHQGYVIVATLPRYYRNGNAAVRMVKRVA